MVRELSLVIAFGIASLTAAGPALGDALNHAAAFGWQGYADTDLQFSEFYGNDHTLMTRFMVQYPNAYTGPILSVNGSGQFLVAKVDAEPRLQVILGGNGVMLDLPNPVQAGVWYHLAVVRSADSFTFYLDGAICQTCTIPAGPTPPSGTLRLARLPDGATAANRDGQFYGFIDDTAVYDEALDASQIAAIAAGPRLTGSEPHLYAGYTFDSVTPAGDELPAALSRPVSFRTRTAGPVIPGEPASVSLVSELRDNAADAQHLPPPFQQVSMRLPFPVGEAWGVIQGWDNSLGSHHGAASFAWDFILAGHPVSATEGKAIFAATPGVVEETRNDRDSCSGFPANYVMVQHAPSEIGAYLHFVKGSVAVAEGQALASGDYLADAGDTGNSSCGFHHLHYALHDLPESQAGALVTFPAAFSNYEVYGNGGWQLVRRGVPRLGELVRAAPNRVELRFDGTIVEVVGEVLQARFAVGHPVSGSILYEADQPDAQPQDPTIGDYLGAIYFASYQFETYTVTGASGDIQVQSGAERMFHRLDGSSEAVVGVSVGNLEPRFLSIRFVDSTATAFSDDSLPTSLNLADFDESTALLMFQDGSANLFGVSAELTALRFTPVPEPAAWAMALAAAATLGTLAAIRRTGPGVRAGER
jgi:hypothetical protein